MNSYKPEPTAEQRIAVHRIGFEKAWKKAAQVYFEAERRRTEWRDREYREFLRPFMEDAEQE